MKAAVLLLALAGAAAAEDFELPPPPPGSRVDYSADQAEFDADHSSLHLSGGVVLKQSTMTVKGQDLWIDTSRRSGRSDAPLLVEDGVSAVYGDSGEFDFAKRTARLFHSSAGSGDWRIHAREGGLRADKSARYGSADFTSCAVVPPHYHFHAHSVYVVPKKYLFATSTTFYLGRMPLFYTPFFYKSLDPKPWLKWQFRPGYDNRDGAYIKGTLTTRYSTTTYSKLFDDYYQNEGFGLGGELDHNAGQDSRGSLFGYRIHEDRTVRNRWGVFGSGYKSVGNGTSLQARVQAQSDATYTNDYVRSDVFRLTPELINSAAVTKIFPKATASLSYARDDVQNPATGRYVKNTESLPRADVQSAPFRAGRLPWLNTLTGYADNNDSLARGYRQRTVNGTWAGTRSFPLFRGLTYTPTLAYSETYYSRFDDPNYLPAAANRFLDAGVGRWTASNNVRMRTPAGNVDVTHAYTQRLRPDDFTADTGPADKGVEQNVVTLADIFVPTPRTWARVATGYSFATFRDRTIGFDQRVQPITTDFSWQTKRNLTFTFHDQYQLGPGKGLNQSAIFDARWGKATGLAVGGGVGYNLTTPGTYYQSLDFSFSPSSPTWRVSIGVRSLAESAGGVSRAHGFRLFEKEITWTRRWHDFYTKVIGRTRPGGVGEVTASVEFRFGSADRTRIEHKDWEAEWFPGRAKDSDEGRP